MQDKILDSRTIKYFPLTNVPNRDRIWDVYASKDGPIYTAACCEAFEVDGIREAFHSKVYAFDPKTETFELAVDMEELSGDRYNGKNVIHGKVHFTMCEGADGTIYGATHMHTIDSMREKGRGPFHWWEQLTSTDRGFVGGKLWAYYPSTKRAEVLCIPQPHQGVRVMTIDERNSRIYGIGFPWSNMWRYDIKTGKVRNVGEVYARINPYGMAVDRLGRVYTMNAYGNIMRYDPQYDMLITLPVQAPMPTNQKYETLCELRMRRNGESMIGTTLYGCRAFEYFPYDGPAGSLKDLGELYPLAEGAEFNAAEAMIEALDGWFYFPVIVGREHSKEARLVRLNPETREVEHLGRIMMGDEPLRGTFRGGLGSDGKVYFGAIRTDPEAELPLVLCQFDPSKI